MTPKEFAHATMLVASLRTRLGHANALTAAVTAERDDLAKQLAAHVESLTLSNAQCAEYLLHNEMLAADRATLHRELVEVRAALASVTEQRDSLRRTLAEWERADTKPHERVTADDVADHVVPPVLPLCNVCHECRGPLICGTVVGSPSVLHCRNERCLRRNTAWRDDVSPYYGPCKSTTPVRHE